MTDYIFMVFWSYYLLYLGTMQLSDVLLYASRTPAAATQFRMHGQMPVANISVSAEYFNYYATRGINNRNGKIY